MKITEKLSILEYNDYCVNSYPKKLLQFKTTDWRQRVGDCLYYTSDGVIEQRRPSVHNEENIKTDLGGLNALLSNQFYYFGNKAIDLPSSLLSLSHKSRGHKITQSDVTITEFEQWISYFKKNGLCGEPQLMYRFDKGMSHNWNLWLRLT
jgi:Nucleotide modification associated domain 2